MNRDDIYHLLVDSVLDYAIFALDRTGHVLTWNKGAGRLKGYEAEEIVGRHFSIFYPEEVAASGHPDRELEIAAAEGHYGEEGWRIRKDGTRFWGTVLITALRDDDGDLVGFAKVTRDLTEKKRAEEALRVSEERFELLVRSVEEYGIFMLDPTGRVVSWNQGAEQIKGYTADEILGRHFSAFYPPEDLEAGKPDMELRVATRTGRYEDEGWRVRKDGTRFWANVVITALREPDEGLVGFAKVTRDLTERRAAEQRALEHTRQVAEAEAEIRAKSEFIAALSHELRTPLNAIAGYAQLLSVGVHGPVTNEQEEALGRIARSQRHLLSLINDLLNFSKIEAGRVTYDLQDVDLGEVAASVRPMIEPQAAEKGITLSWQGPEGPVEARADPAKTEQILLNLLTNAIKYTPADGHVVVEHGERDGAAVLAVRDDGIGIDPERQEEIFEPFIQIGRTLSSPDEGTGLGLAISRDLARAMGGDVIVASEPGEGSTFTLLLPRAGGAEE